MDMIAKIIPHTGKSLQKLKSKYPVVYSKLLEGNPDCVRWLLDNQQLYMSEAPAYTVIQESRLLAVDKKGTHQYK